MKHIYHACAVLLLLYIFGSASTLAENSLATTLITGSAQQSILENTGLVYIKKEPKKRAIKCFDVRSDGAIAIGSEDSTQKTICVYSNEGVFEYGYDFRSSGDFGVEFEGENLVIWYLRSDISITVTPDGKVKEVHEIESTPAYSVYWRDKLRSKTRTIGETVYTIKNEKGISNFLASSYSLLVASEADGENQILYDVSADQFAASILRIVLISVLATVWFAIMLHALRTFNKRKRDIRE